MPRARRNPKPRRERDENESELRQLVLFLEEPGFRLGLVTFDTAQTRQTQLARLAERLAPRPVFLTTLDLSTTPGETQLLQRLRDHLREHPAPEGTTPAVMVVGLEALLDYRETDPGVPSPQPILRDANIQRDAYPRFVPCPVVVWLFPTASRIFALEAPDLWHWRSGSFNFTGPSDGRKQLEQSQVEMPLVRSESLPRAEKADRIALLHDLLVELENAEDRDTKGNKARRAGLLLELGLAYNSISKADRAKTCMTEAVHLYQEIGDRHGEGNALGNLGLAYTALGQSEKAIGFYEQHQAIACEIGDRRGEGIDLGNLGNAYVALAQPKKAIGFYEQALAIAREIGDRRGEDLALGNLGNAYAHLGQPEQAIGFSEQALAIAREIGDRRGESGNLGLAYARLGQPEKAREFLKQALQIAQAIKDPGITEFASHHLMRLSDESLR